MTILQIHLDDEQVYNLGRNAEYGTVQVKLDRLPQNALAYLFDYGLRQVINDAIANKVDKDGNTLPDAAITDKALAKLEALYNGSIRTRSEAAFIDPVEAEACKEMKRHLILVMTRNGLMRDIPKKTENRFLFAVNRVRATAGLCDITERDYIMDRLATPAGQKILDAARKTVAERRALEDEMGDLL